MFAQGPTGDVAGHETLVLIGALLALVLVGKVVWGKSAIGRRPAQRAAALAILVVFLIVLIMIAVFSSR